MWQSELVQGVQPLLIPGITLEDALNTLQNLVEMVKNETKPSPLKVSDLIPIENIIAFGIQKATECTGLPKKAILEHLEEYVTTNKPKVNDLRKFFNLKEQQQQQQQQQQQVVEDKAESRKKKELFEYILGIVDLTRQFKTKGELEQQMGALMDMDGCAVFKHYTDFLELIQNILLQHQ